MTEATVLNLFIGFVTGWFVTSLYYKRTSREMIQHKEDIKKSGEKHTKKIIYSQMKKTAEIKEHQTEQTQEVKEFMYNLVAKEAIAEGLPEETVASLSASVASAFDGAISDKWPENQIGGIGPLYVIPGAAMTNVIDGSKLFADLKQNDEIEPIILPPSLEDEDDPYR